MKGRELSFNEILSLPDGTNIWCEWDYCLGKDSRLLIKQGKSLITEGEEVQWALADDFKALCKGFEWLEWTYENNSNDIWIGRECFHTKQEAIDVGKNWAREEGLSKFHVGRKVNVSLLYGADAESVLDGIACHFHDELGEVAENYLNDVTEEHLKELDTKLNKVLYQWMNKYGYTPSFFRITDAEVISIS